MIDLMNGRIKQFGKDEPIRNWIVVFQTPTGWFEQLSDAIKTCEEMDLDPRLCIVPAVMAISETLHELR